MFDLLFDFVQCDRGRSDSCGTGCELRGRSSIPKRSRGAVLLRSSRPVRSPPPSCALFTGIIAPGVNEPQDEADR